MKLFKKFLEGYTSFLPQPAQNLSSEEGGILFTWLGLLITTKIFFLVVPKGQSKCYQKSKLGDENSSGLSSMVVCFDFRSTNLVQLSNCSPYFYQFRCHHPLIIQLTLDSKLCQNKILIHTQGISNIYLKEVLLSKNMFNFDFIQISNYFVSL